MTEPSPTAQSEVGADRRFPILLRGGPDRPRPTIPWAMIALHERQAVHNHSQTLKRLAERGGLCWSEALAVLNDRPWHKVAEDTAEAIVRQLATKFAANAP